MVCCSLCVVRCSLFVIDVRCLLFVGCGLLYAPVCMMLLCAVCCVLLAMCSLCVLCVACCLVLLNCVVFAV